MESCRREDTDQYQMKESKEELSDEENMDCIDCSRGTVNIQWSSPGILLSGCRKYL